MQDRGTIDLYLSRPVSRFKLLMSRYVAGLILAASNVIYLLGTIWLIVAWKTGVANPRFLLAGAIILNIGWFLPQETHGAPDGGWFGYAPLTSKNFIPKHSIDYWVMGLQLLGVASIAASLNFIVTIINMRAPGMTMMRLPVFVWMTLVTSFLIILAFVLGLNYMLGQGTTEKLSYGELKARIAAGQIDRVVIGPKYFRGWYVNEWEMPGLAVAGWDWLDWR